MSFQDELNRVTKAPEDVLSEREKESYAKGVDSAQTSYENIKEELHKEKIPMSFYNNEHDGGSNSIGESVFLGDINFAATAWTSSEGENITLNLSKIASKWRNFILTGEVNDVSTKFAKSFREACDIDIDNKKITSKKRFILLDAMDSGYSIDNVIEMKSLFDLVLEDSEKMGMETYIIVSSNEYELACNTDCFDVTEGKYINFSSYEDFKKTLSEFIMVIMKSYLEDTEYNKDKCFTK